MALPMRPMGSQGMMASMQGFGCMGLTSFYGKPLEESVAHGVLQKAFDLGITHFDSAEIYTGEDAEGKKVYNEEVLGKWVAKVGREKVTVTTKLFPAGPGKEACEPAAVREAFTTSLQRLGMDYVDLYYMHRVPSMDALKNFMTVCKELVAEGKIKYVGISEATPAEVRAAHAIHPLTAVQQEWSLLVRNLEAELVPTCRELGIAVVAYSPMCRGFTSGLVKKFDDWSKIGNEGGARDGFQSGCPHLGEANVEHNAKLLEPLEKQAAELGVTPAQLSLAWVQSCGPDVFPIPGTTKIANLESNVSAAKLCLDLPKEKLEALGTAVDWKQMAGDRYPAGFQGMCFESRK